MDIREIVENLINELKKDGNLKIQFEKDPIKVIEKVIGKDLPDDMLKPVIEGVSSKIDLDMASDILEKVDLGKVSDVLDKVGLDDAAKALDKVDDVADALKKLF